MLLGRSVPREWENRGEVAVVDCIFIEFRITFFASSCVAGNAEN